MSLNNKESKKYHTDAEYRCRVTSIRNRFYLIQQCAILKNNGDKKTLYIPRNEIFLKKDMVKDQLQIGDYVAIKIEVDGRRINVTQVLSVDKVMRLERKEKKENKSTKKDDSNTTKSGKVTNLFSLLMDSDSDSDSESDLE